MPIFNGLGHVFYNNSGYRSLPKAALAVHRCFRVRAQQCCAHPSGADRYAPVTNKNPLVFSPILDFAQNSLLGLAGDCCLSNKIYQAFEMLRVAESILAWLSQSPATDA
jgi:hypothetical protein